MDNTKYNFIKKDGQVKVIRDLYIRIGQPSITAPYLRLTRAGEVLSFDGWVENGETFKGIAKWFRTKENNYFWSGNVESGKENNQVKIISIDDAVKDIKFLYWPLDELICTQKFGERPEVYSKMGMLGHNGLDFRTRSKNNPQGECKVCAVMDGIVSEAVSTDNSGYGKNVRLVHEGGSETIYAHFSSLNVVENQKVKSGDLLGKSGNTGFSTAPHLHFGYRPKKSVINYDNGYKGWINPESFFNR